MNGFRRLVLVALLGATVGACGTAGTPSASPGAPASPGPGATTPVDPTPVPVPSQPGDGISGGGSGSSGGSAPGNPGTGGGDPLDPGPPLDDSQAALVTPVAGLFGVRDIGAATLSVAVDGRHVTAKVAWWSGVEPCSVYAGADVTRDGSTITITIREGSAAQGVACIEIAMFKAAIVDLGDLDPGTWTIRAQGEAAPVEVTIAE